MSSVYGGGPPGSGYGVPAYDYGPTYRVSWGWIGESWAMFGANVGPWIVAVLLTYVAPAVVIGVIDAVFGTAAGSTHTLMPGSPPIARTAGGDDLPPALNILVQLCNVAWATFMCCGANRMAVKQVRGEPVDVSDLFSGRPAFFTMLGALFVFGFAALTGLCLCVLPIFIVMAIGLPLFPLVSDGVSFSDAISRSVQGMSRDLVNASLFVFVFCLILLASAVPCFLGLLATYPMFWIIGALAYRDMVGFGGGSGYMPNYGYQAAGVWPPPPISGQSGPTVPRPLPPGYAGGSEPDSNSPGQWP